MDGTIYKGGTLFDFTRPFLERLDRLGIGYTFLTNNPSKSTNDYLSHLRRLGVEATPEQLYTSTQATIDWLRLHQPEARRLFVLGTPSMASQFQEAGFVLTAESPTDEPDAVVIGFDLTLVYVRVCRAAWWIQQGKPFVATNPDLVCPTDQPTVLVDCGAICALLEKATGRAPDIVLGKPDPAMLDGILRRHGLHAHEIAMVGDRLYTDILLAQRANAFGVLVLTGEATSEDGARAASPPDLVVPSLAEFGALLTAAHAAGSST
jgi:HAD superfamily hydrolase (TIGR01450 family)